MAANVIDLTTVDAVADYLNQPENLDVSLIQGLVTSYSQAILTRTGRGNLSSIKTYSETYSGTGSNRQQLRNYPILSVTSLVVGTTPIPQSPGPNRAGWVIDTAGSQAALAIISPNWVGNWSAAESPWRGGNWGGGNAPPLGNAQYCFVQGVMNVAVTYQAGYVLETLEVDTIPATPGPYTVKVAQAAKFYADQGVTLANGTPLELVTGAPASGQYSVTAGTYTFNVAQQGASVNISYQYGGTPFDLAEAVTEWCGDVYRSRQWIGQKSQMQPNVGTTSYATWPMPDRVKSLCDFYRMRFLPS
jgi:hypothetical protein